MNRYFKTTPEIYEAIRVQMDAASGFPNNEAATWFKPASEAPKDSEGNCLIGCIPQIAEKFELSGAVELTAKEYTEALPLPDSAE